MRLEGLHSKYVKVEISDSDIIEATIKILKKRHSLENVDGLDEKGRMYESCEYVTSHSWTKIEDRGEPKTNQRKALEIIEGLRQNLRG